MSELGRALILDRTGRQMAQPGVISSILRVTSDVSTACVVTRLIEYKLSAEFRTVFKCADNAVPDDVEQRARKHIQNAVFGEFVAPLQYARYLLDNYENAKAQRILSDVIDSFFNAEPMPRSM